MITELKFNYVSFGFLLVKKAEVSTDVWQKSSQYCLQTEEMLKELYFAVTKRY